jgi:hypothetical protein
LAHGPVDLVSSRDDRPLEARAHVSEPALPRYFVPSEAHARVSAAARGPLVHCADSFRLLSGGRSEDVIVGVDRTGELSYATGAAHTELSEQARRELGVHELLCATAQRPHARTISAERLFLFEMEFLEQVSGRELNQPVYAYGTLLGPIASEVSTRIRGQLTLTRADLLEGFAIGSAFAFRCADALGRTRSVHHALLPAARAEEIAQGRDVLLAYPLPPAELAEEDLENAAIVQLLVAELVQGLRKDLEREERARGLLQKWFGADRATSLAEPENADFAASMGLVDAALRCIPAWPSARASALRARIVDESALAGRATTHARPQVTQKAPDARSEAASPAPSAVQAAVAPRAPLWKKPGDAPPDWTRDFLPEQHRNDPAANFVSWKAPRSAKKPPDGTDWMDDFRASAQSDDAASGHEKATRPDWMRDFDDE